MVSFSRRHSIPGSAVGFCMLLLLASCSANESRMSGGRNVASAPEADLSVQSKTTQNFAESEIAANDVGAAAAETVTPNAPQLVKRASMSQTVESATEALQASRRIISQYQGDILGLQDSPPSQGGGRHRIGLEIRVPQAKLDPMLEALSQLGTIQTRNLSAEDVSAQLVDFDARLRNLRKTESTLLTIMDRSGSVADVLKVAQELSRVRDETERIAAQIANLKNQVAFSHISLSLEQVIASPKQQRPFGAEFQEAWEDATSSVVGLTVGLGKLGLWLIAYTPYWIVLGVLLWVWKTRFFPGRKPSPQPAVAHSTGTTPIPSPASEAGATSSDDPGHDTSA